MKSRQIGITELKAIQLNIAEALHTFCNANEIKYSLACGSLLGAIRHNGYIPWDDDIDIYMERDDYNKFIRLFPEKYNGIYEFISIERNKKWNIPYGKIFDNRTIVYENAIDWIPIGVNIDVFPVDNVPSDSNQWHKYNRIRIIIRDFINYKYYKLTWNNNLIKYLLGIILKIIFLFITKRSHAYVFSWFSQIYNSKDTGKLFENVQGIFQKSPFNKEDFESTIMHKFEDREFCIMSGYHNYLSQGYGDYMKLPPIEKQVSHHSFQAYRK